MVCMCMLCLILFINLFICVVSFFFCHKRWIFCFLENHEPAPESYVVCQSFPNLLFPDKWFPPLIFLSTHLLDKERHRCSTVNPQTVLTSSPQYPGVPHTVFIVTWSSTIFDSPKSAGKNPQNKQSHNTKVWQVSYWKWYINKPNGEIHKHFLSRNIPSRCRS